MCRKYFERKTSNAHTIYQNGAAVVFCSKICTNIYIISKREIAPCQWCKVRKYNFDMIHKISGSQATRMLCSLNCLAMFEVSMNAIAMKQQKCDQCDSMATPQYHLTMSDASMRNFCTYQCVMSFQSQFSRAPLTLENENGAQNRPVPTGLPKRIKSQQQLPVQQQKKTTTRATAKTNNYQAAKQSNTNNNLVISSVTSLAQSTRSTRRGSQTSNNSDLNRLQPVVELNRLQVQPMVQLEPIIENVVEKPSRSVGRPRNSQISIENLQPAQPLVRVEKETQIVTIPPLPKRIANAGTMCSPSTHNKEIQARPMQFTVGCQTESYLERKLVIPIPVPMYVLISCAEAILQISIMFLGIF